MRPPSPETVRAREPAVNTFLTSLAVDRNVAVSTQNKALAALLFLSDGVLGAPFVCRS